MGCERQTLIQADRLTDGLREKQTELKSIDGQKVACPDIQMDSHIYHSDRHVHFSSPYNSKGGRQSIQQ